MDAKTFGAFLAKTRRARGLTQSSLAERLNVTDKAVSRWERGLGFPDINTLEPLADALGLTLAQLMHADAGDGASTPQPLEDFFSLMAPGHTQWISVANTILWLTIGLALWILLFLPFQVAVRWHLESNGVLTPSLTLSKPVSCLITVGLGVLMTQVCKAAEHGLFRSAFFVWGRAFHPRLFPWLELAFHLCYIWLALSPLFIETMIIFFN